MDDQRISVNIRKIELVLVGGSRLSGDLFLQLQGHHLTGPQRISEVLNSDETFLPVRTETGVKMFNLDQVIAVYASAEEEFDPLLTLGEEHAVRVTTAVEEPMCARIFVNLPHPHNRVKDFLNQQKRFLLFLLGEQVVYLARKRILLVED